MALWNMFSKLLQHITLEYLFDGVAADVIYINVCLPAFSETIFILLVSSWAMWIWYTLCV